MTNKYDPRVLSAIPVDLSKYQGTNETEKLLQDIAAGKYKTPTVSADAYMGTASNLLGGMDTSGFDQLRSAYEASNATAQQELQSSYDQLLADLAAQDESAQKQLAGARGTIMEDAFSRNRDLYRNLAARGLGASGLQQLGEVQNRMETGRQVSGVTGQYYDTAEQLANAEQKGTTQFQQSQAELANQLQQNLAGVQQQEVSYRNTYQQQLASLAMQLQSNAQSALQADYASMLGARTELAKMTDAANDPTTIMSIINSELPIEEKVTALMSQTNMDEATARATVSAKSAAYETGIKNEMLSNFSEQVSNIDNYQKTTSVLNNMKTSLYDSGALNRSEIKSYLLNNWDKFGDAKNWVTDEGLGKLSGIVDIPVWAVANENNRFGIEVALKMGNKSKDAIADMILDFYKIY